MWRDTLDSPDAKELVTVASKRIPERMQLCEKCSHFQSFIGDGRVNCGIGRICCGGKRELGMISLAWDMCPELTWAKNMFGKVYVVSLQRRADRLMNFKQAFSKINWPFVEPEVFNAIDGNKVPTPSGVSSTARIRLRATIGELRPEDQKKFNLDELIPEKQNQWGAGGGAWGCMQSHRRILEDCMMNDIDSVLVFEDDALPTHDFNNQLPEFLSNLPPNWDGIMFGGQHFIAPKEIAPGVGQCYNTQRTHAYALRGKLLKDVYAMWHSHFWHCDHALGPFIANYNVFAPTPFLFGQARTSSDITGHPEPARFWSGTDAKTRIMLLTALPNVVRELRSHGVHTGYTRNWNNDVDMGLLKIFTTYKTSLNNKVRELRAWIAMIQSEAAAFEHGIGAIWYPDLNQENLQAIRLAAGPSLIEMRINDVNDYLQQREKYVVSSQSV